MKTKAAILRQCGQPMSIETIDVAPPQNNEVLVEVKASGICRSDLNSYFDPATPLPIILGHEGAGVVKALGKGVTHVKEGDHVALSWVPSCGNCFYCLKGTRQLCDTVAQHLLNGTLLDGTKRFTRRGTKIGHYSLISTFSNHTVVPAKSCVPIPQELPFEQACLLGCSVATGWGAARKAGNVQAGDHVAIFGSGGVGVAAIMGAKGARADKIIAIDRKLVNLENAYTSGATDSFLAPEAHDKKSSEDLIAKIIKLTAGRGVDCAIDTTGHTAGFEGAWHATRKGGTIIVVGAYMANTMSIPGKGFHQKAKTIKGCFYGDIDPYKDLQHLANLALQGELPLVSLIRRRVKFNELNDAMLALDDPKTCNMGRTVLTFD